MAGVSRTLTRTVVTTRASGSRAYKGRQRPRRALLTLERSAKRDTRIHALRDSVGQHSTRLCSHEMLSVHVAGGQRSPLKPILRAEILMRNRPHLLASSPEALHGFRTCRPLQALAITLDREPLALRSTRNRLRTAVRQGASWTAAYHLPLLSRGARPVPSSVVPSASLLLRGPGCSPRRRLPGAASSRSRAVGRRGRGRHGQQPRHGVGRRCPAGGVHPSGFRRPGSGCPAVRCPVTWGRRPAGPAVGRLLSTRPVSSRLVSAPGPSGRVRLLPCSGAGVGDQVEVAGRL
jgi:hypothetical protein